MDPYVRWCPKPDCGTMLRAESLDVKYLTCHVCKEKVCFNCNEKWHPKISCERASDKSYSNWSMRKKNVDKCPNCKLRIEKESGCNHMTCWYCKYEFCWICKAEAFEGSGHFDPYSWNGCGAAMLDDDLNPRDYIRIRNKKRSLMCCICFMIPFMLLFITP